MTPADVLRAVEAAMCPPPPRGWVDCALAVHEARFALDGATPLRGWVDKYDSILSARRLVVRLGGFVPAAHRAVAANGFRQSPAHPGAVGITTNEDRFFGMICGICIDGTHWAVPELRGFRVVTGMSVVWGR